MPPSTHPGAREECPADGSSGQLPAQLAPVGGGLAGAAAGGDLHPPAATSPALRPDGGSGR